MGFKEDYRSLKESEKTMTEMLTTLRKLLDDNLVNAYALPESFASNLEAAHSTDELREMSDDQIDEMVKGFMSEGEYNAHIVALKNLDDGTEKDFVISARTGIDSYNSSLIEKNNISADIEAMSTNYLKYLNSDDYKVKKEEQLTKLRESIDNETDEGKKKKLIRKLEAIEKSEDMSFIIDYIKSQGTLHLSNAFFSNQKGSYTINKFVSKAKLLGYQDSIVSYMLRMEESFLPEEYHVFNNMYSFIAMRFVAYCDPYDEIDALYAHRVILNIMNLVSHSFITPDLEIQFTNHIKEAIDLFEDYREKYTSDNITCSNHPDNPINNLEIEGSEEVTESEILETQYEIGDTEDMDDDSEYVFVDEETGEEIPLGDLLPGDAIIETNE